MARRNSKSNTFRRFSDALKLLVELNDYPKQLAVEALVCALKTAPRSAWKAEFKGHRVPDLWTRLNGKGEPQLFVDPHYEENWIGATDTRGPYTAYAIQVADKVLLPLLPAGAGSLLPPPKKQQRHKKHAGGRKKDWNYAKIERAAENYIKTYGLPATKILLIEKVEDACKVAGVTADREKTQFKEIVRSVYRRHEGQKNRRKLVSDQDRQKRPPIQNK